MSGNPFHHEPPKPDFNVWLLFKLNTLPKSTVVTVDFLIKLIAEYNSLS